MTENRNLNHKPQTTHAHAHTLTISRDEKLGGFCVSPRCDVVVERRDLKGLSDEVVTATNGREAVDNEG